MDEFNPWLRRAGWIPYLENCTREDTLRSMREPMVDGENIET